MSWGIALKTVLTLHAYVLQNIKNSWFKIGVTQDVSVFVPTPTLHKGGEA